MQSSLFEQLPYACALTRIDPDAISVAQVDTAAMVEYQRVMSKAVWRPAPGRKLAFFVMHDTTMIGLIFLASPVINLGPRDKYLKLPQDPSEKGHALRSIMDISVCVGAQPLAWHWNIGKLCALLATTLGDVFEQRYGDVMRYVTTTSLWGRGSQYNRCFKFIGYTSGYGHEHVSDERYKQMLEWMRSNGHDIPSCRFGDGSNPRMRRIAAYRKASGDKTVTLRHGNIRGIYVHDAIHHGQRHRVIFDWYKRWGLPRYDRTKNLPAPYMHGLESKNEG